MDYSSLWVMDKDFYGSELITFTDTRLFTPVIWEVLFDKYLPHRNQKLPNGEVAGYWISTIIDRTIGMDLNECINNCENLSDRIAWEIGNGQVFHTKDKEIIANGLREFFVKSKAYLQNAKNKSVLEVDCIIARLHEITESILALDVNKNPYFIFKNINFNERIDSWLKI